MGLFFGVFDRFLGLCARLTFTWFAGVKEVGIGQLCKLYILGVILLSLRLLTRITTGDGNEKGGSQAIIPRTLSNSHEHIFSVLSSKLRPELCLLYYPNNVLAANHALDKRR